MKFLVADLERQAIDFDESLAPGTIDFVDDMQQVGVLHTQGHVDLLKEHRGPSRYCRGHPGAGQPGNPHGSGVCALPGPGVAAD